MEVTIVCRESHKIISPLLFQARSLPTTVGASSYPGHTLKATNSIAPVANKRLHELVAQVVDQGAQNVLRVGQDIKSTCLPLQSVVGMIKTMQNSKKGLEKDVHLLL